MLVRKMAVHDWQGVLHHSSKHSNPHTGEKGPYVWDVLSVYCLSPIQCCYPPILPPARVFFAIMFALSVAELCFTVDSFQYLQKKKKWWSGMKRARLTSLIFSAARTILLSTAYIGWNCDVKHMHTKLHIVGVKLTQMAICGNRSSQLFRPFFGSSLVSSSTKCGVMSNTRTKESPTTFKSSSRRLRVV